MTAPPAVIPHGSLPESVSRHHGPLGTVIEVRARCRPDDVEAVVEAAMDEVARLEAVFSAHDPTSELSRWKRDELDAPSPELVEVMSVALEVQRSSGGALNPMAGLACATWRRAAETGVRPSSRELAAIADAIAAPRYDVRDGELRRLGDCDALDLNAIAKGSIVDRALDAAWAVAPCESLLVSAGGDLAHRGEVAALVGVADPLRPFDGEPPLVVIEVAGRAVATSGGARRGFVVGGERVSHVVDPRTAEPVRTHASITVVAPDARTADATTTVLGVEAPAAAVAAAERLDDVACLVVDAAGGRHADERWRGLVVADGR